MIKASPAFQYIVRPLQTESVQAVSTRAAKLQQWVYTACIQTERGCDCELSECAFHFDIKHRFQEFVI